MDIISLHQVIKFALALIFVLSLMGGLALIMKRINSGRPLANAPKRRLKLVESLPLDAKRRLVLLRRDNTEHLVILGAGGETVIEAQIAADLQQDEKNETIR